MLRSEIYDDIVGPLFVNYNFIDERTKLKEAAADDGEPILAHINGDTAYETYIIPFGIPDVDPKGEFRHSAPRKNYVIGHRQLIIVSDTALRQDRRITDVGHTRPGILYLALLNAEGCRRKQ